MVKPNSNSIGSSSSNSSMVLQSSHGSNNGAANKSGKSQYKGVRMRSWGSWVSEIRAPNQKTRIWLGSYSTPEAAARAYDAALICLKGTSASLNFPTSAHRLHLPDAVMSPKSIQRVAAAAAANATTSQSTSATSQTPAFHSPSPSPSQSWEDDDTMMISGEGKEQLDCLFDTSVDYFEAFFQSPKCMDYMLNPSAFFAPPPVEECSWGEEGEISLWSF